MTEQPCYFTEEQARVKIEEITARWPRPDGLDGTTALANADIAWLLGWITLEEEGPMTPQARHYLTEHDHGHYHPSEQSAHYPDRFVGEHSHRHDHLWYPRDRHHHDLGPDDEHRRPVR